MTLERRFVTFDCKSSGLSEDGTFEGYGSVFGVLDSYDDEVMPGAFKRSLDKHNAEGTWPDMLFSHMVTEPIGEWLELREDHIGLFGRGRLWIGQDGKPADPYALKTHRAMQRKRGKLGLSIGFMANRKQDKGDVRQILEADLWEISPVVFPANTAARVLAVRSAFGEIPTAGEFERFLRHEAGFTEAQAKCIVAKGFRQLLREAEDHSSLVNHTDVTTRREAMPSDTHPEADIAAAIRAAIPALRSTDTWSQNSRG